MNILFLGDIFGKPGRDILKRNLKYIKKELSVDLCIANFENLADGKGITEKTAKEVFSYGVDLASGGNHTFDKPESFNYLASESRICVPMNRPKPEVGFKSATKHINGLEVMVVNLLGQNFMGPADSPFQKIDQFLNENDEKIVIVDFHAEATAEKRAMGWYLDGRVSAVLGTHTHIQTADEEVLPRGTAYITDVGMTGSHDSVIGVRKEAILSKFVDGIHKPHFAANRGMQINGVIITIDDKTNKTTKINRIRRRFDGENS